MAAEKGESLEENDDCTTSQKYSNGKEQQETQSKFYNCKTASSTVVKDEIVKSEYRSDDARTKNKPRGRPKMTLSQKEHRRLAKERGEAITIRGYMGKEFEQVFDDQGKAIGKKDADGNFIPYKARGRPVMVMGKGIDRPRNVTERKVTANMDLEEMLNNEVIRREKPPVSKRQKHDSSESDYNLP